MPLWIMLKQMLPGLLPLFVFIAADEIWGTETGLYVAVLFGIVELFITRIKNGRYDRFIIFDTAFLVILGAVSILLENEIFFKLKPALIEGILCVILAVSVFTPANIVLAMSQRYMKNVNMTLTDAGINAMRRMLKILLTVTSLHAALVVYSAFYMSKESWLFISGVLFYIIFAVLFFAQILYYRIRLWRIRRANKKQREKK